MHIYSAPVDKFLFTATDGKYNILNSFNVRILCKPHSKSNECMSTEGMRAKGMGDIHRSESETDLSQTEFSIFALKQFHSKSCHNKI